MPVVKTLAGIIEFWLSARLQVSLTLGVTSPLIMPGVHCVLRDIVSSGTEFQNLKKRVVKRMPSDNILLRA